MGLRLEQKSDLEETLQVTCGASGILWVESFAAKRAGKSRLPDSVVPESDDLEQGGRRPPGYCPNRP